MDINGLLNCDLCTRYIAVDDKTKVNFGNQDFHFTCYQKQLQNLFSMKRVLARQTSYRESERLISTSRMLGG
jgi:hypothetical protein